MQATQSTFPLKIQIMQQEILLMTATSFVQRQEYQNMDAASTANLTQKEQLEDACWKGMLQDMLPEILQKSANGKLLPLWQIRDAETFLELELGESPEANENYYSVYPPISCQLHLHGSPLLMLFQL
jgi:hypothetical protein